MIRISDFSFQIALAEIWQDPSDENECFRFSIAGESKRIDGEIWEPRIYWEDLHLSETNLALLKTEIIDWNAGEILLMEAPPTLFVFEHLTISSGFIRVARLNDNFISFYMEGMCDVFFGAYQSDLPIVVETELKVNHQVSSQANCVKKIKTP